MPENGSGPYMSVREALEDHELRLRRVETWMRALPVTLVTSMVAAIAAIVAAIK